MEDNLVEILCNEKYSANRSVSNVNKECSNGLTDQIPGALCLEISIHKVSKSSGNHHENQSVVHPSAFSCTYFPNSYSNAD